MLYWLGPSLSEFWFEPAKGPSNCQTCEAGAHRPSDRSGQSTAFPIASTLYPLRGRRARSSSTPGRAVSCPSNLYHHRHKADRQQPRSKMVHCRSKISGFIDRSQLRPSQGCARAREVKHSVRGQLRHHHALHIIGRWHCFFMSAPSSPRMNLTGICVGPQEQGSEACQRGHPKSQWVSSGSPQLTAECSSRRIYTSRCTSLMVGTSRIPGSR